MGKKRQKKGDLPNKAEPKQVDEATRIRISKVLDQFRISKDLVFTFQENLSNRERAIVHEACKKMGMTSRSSGRGAHRHVSVYKSRKKEGMNSASDTVANFVFSDHSKEILCDLFTTYPPDDGELVKETSGERSGRARRQHRNKDEFFCRPSIGKREILNKVKSLASRMESNSNLKKINEGRSKLPITSFKDLITSTVDSHQVVLVSGETGCGKTTQVPQYLLDHVWGKGETCKIVCTQPRRISATSVSERIAYERGEDVGNDIGYKIRLESKGGRQSSVVFCTNGILLRVLVSNGGGKSRKVAQTQTPSHEVSDITHIIVDEIHERDRFSDVMLAIIRDMLPSFPQLRLILMSATIDAERFSQYFGDCPIIRVPGFTYPVKSFYLEDVLSFLKSSENNHLELTGLTEEPKLTEEDNLALDEAINLAWSNDEFDLLLELVSSEAAPQVFNYQHSLNGLTPLMVFAGKGRVRDVCMLLSFGADCQLKAKDGTTALEWAEKGGHKETAEVTKKHMQSALSSSAEEKELLDKYLMAINQEMVDIVLIEQLLRQICFDSQDGAVLVFLPGWDEINKTRERLQASPIFKDASKFLILPLHSRVPAAEQKKVFKRAPPGCRKIVLSTNIAETAVTIDDVVYVIDSGRMKEKSYDPYNNVTTLQSSWVSKASAKQRQGRAGRCQPGICYHLYSRLRSTTLPDFQVPEIKRMPIEELCLQVKMVDPEAKIEDFLQKTLDPPIYETIRNAIMILQDIGALTLEEKLTDLGQKLGSLPVHPLTCKMLFFAILMNCLEPALTLACASGYRDPFTLPMLPNEKKRAAAAKAELSSLYGAHGDQLAVIAAFECWKSAKDRHQEALFCSEYFVSANTMRMLKRMRKQLQSELIRNGFMVDGDVSYSLNARDPGILQAVLVAGLYPMVGVMCPPQGNRRRSLVETTSGDKVPLHSNSVNFDLSFKKSKNHSLIVYDEVTRGDGGLKIRDCTVVGPLSLLIHAADIAVAPGNGVDDDVEDDEGEDSDDGGEDESDEDGMEIDNKPNKKEEKIMASPNNSVIVVVDRWLSFGSTALDIAQIYCLRERLAAAILHKVTHPKKALPPSLWASMSAIACILSSDGLSGVSFSLDSVESLTSKVNSTGINNMQENQNLGGQNSNGFLGSLFNSGTQQPPSASSLQQFSGPEYQGPTHMIVESTSQHLNPPHNRKKQTPEKKPVQQQQRAPTQNLSLNGFGLDYGPYGPLKRHRG